MNIFISLTDHGRTDSHCDYSADRKVVQNYSTDPRVVKDSHSDFSADRSVMQYGADTRVL